MTPSKMLNRSLLLGAFAVAALSPQTTFAKDKLQADPFVFNAKANDPNQCGSVYPAGANIVTSAWLRGMGLPDDGSSNSLLDTNSTSPNPGPNLKDPHYGLLLNKNGPTTECASSGARIKHWKSGDTISQLGFDYRNGGHCGAGAPRFNIVSTAGFTYFAGCSAGTPTPAPQDPTEWTRIVINSDGQVFAAGAGPTFQIGVTPVKSISIVFDEGTSTANNDADGVGLAVIDNININGAYIMSGRGIEPESNGEGHHH